MPAKENGNGAVSTPYKEALIRIGETILLGRRRLSLSQDELADKCNAGRLTTLTRTRMSDIENGKTEPSWLEIQAIADVMSKDLNEFRV
jgi:transcriptional regulator with XRE-family HTH domain